MYNSTNLFGMLKFETDTKYIFQQKSWKYSFLLAPF